MPTLSLRRKTALLLLGLTLALPWRAMAEPHREPACRAAPAAQVPLDLAGRLWSFLTSLWGETGCYIDPNGRCLAGPDPEVAGQTDTGCHIDPDGCRAAQSTTLTSPADEGCHIDPDGCRLR